MPTLLEGDKGLRPLEPSEFRKNKDGSISTELLVDYEIDGQHVVLPSLWMSQRGPVDLTGDDDAIINSAREYERRTGRKFPRFATSEGAQGFASARTQSGGVAIGPLAR